MFSKETIFDVLRKYRVIAVVGASRNPEKDSFKVASYLKSKGYEVIPINPFTDEILGEKSYKSILDLPEEKKKRLEVVDIFRPSEEVPSVVDQAIELKKRYGKPHVVWMQLGIRNDEAAKKAASAGLTVIMDKCIMMEHRSNEDMLKIHFRKEQNG